MSDDKQAAKELVETLKDGERGFASAADKLKDGEHPEWAATLQRLSEQRAGFVQEIVALGHEYGDDVDESGTVAAALHRGWISLKDALTGDDAGRRSRGRVDRRGSRGLRVREGAPAGPQLRVQGRREPSARSRGRRPRRGESTAGCQLTPRRAAENRAMADEVQLTPDGRYIVVDGRRWRATDPQIPEERRQVLTQVLMAWRREVGRRRGTDGEARPVPASRRPRSPWVSAARPGGSRPPRAASPVVDRG